MSIYRTVEVEVDLGDFSTEDLLEELESRNAEYSVRSHELLSSIYEKRRLGKDYQVELDSLIY